MPHRPAVELRARKPVGDQYVFAAHRLLADASMASRENFYRLLKIGRQYRDARRFVYRSGLQARARQIVRPTERDEELQEKAPSVAVVGARRAMSLEIDEFCARRGDGGIA